MRIHREPHIIVAYDNNRLIGHQNALPWAGDLPADMKHFKEKTVGNIVLMGRTTYESIGRPLPERENRVLTTQADLEIPGCQVFTDPEEALSVDEDDQREIYVIGGEQIYQLYLPMARFITATEIDGVFEGDTFFPKTSDAWELYHNEDHEADGKNKYDYSITTYKRHSEFIDVSKARSSVQYEQYRRIDLEGECPFCPEAIADLPKDELNVIGGNEHWTVSKNMIPYSNTDTHFMLIPKHHVTKPDELTPDEWQALQHIIVEYTDDLPYGGIAFRFGDFTKTAASVAHLHIHILKPQDNLPEDESVRFKISG